MKPIDINVARFKEQVCAFLNECETVGRMQNVWNETENGKMEAYYENIFLSLVLRLIAKDGEIREGEIAYLNRCFFDYAVDYTPDRLTTIYRNSADILSDSFVQWLNDGSDLLTWGSMKQDYIELIRLICCIIIQSDDEVTEEEIAEAEGIMANVL